MSNKVINIIIFTIAGIGCLLALWFSMSFNDDNKDLYYEIGTIKATNPQVLGDFNTVILDQLPEFVQKNNNELTKLNDDLKAEQLQKDILYTFIVQLKDLNENSFAEYKANFTSSSAILFAKSDKGNYYKESFNKVNAFADLQPFIQTLDAEYAVVKQDFLENKEYKVALEKFNARSKTITEVVSDTKRTADFDTLKSEVKSYERENKMMDWSMIFTYIIFIIAVGITLFFMVYQIAKNFRSSYQTLLGVLAIVIVFVIAYFASSDELSASAIREGLTGGDVKIIGAGIITTYVLLFGAIASIFIAMLIRKFKKS
ncbi:MAG: hypothetical protein LBV02_06350 [Bacteroidales bacterium]|jgi:hypothetical protein|nr:hypothetical protein [Bacteroidales bacterium]